ncbi:MAG: hypothetical protein TYPL_5260 [Candidatus Tyloplasma litorale]|nr:MAG: hypothetical protein TYPL_5260 [Mycoplasmatales bacterium]
MGIKDFMYTEKGKITASVLTAILITTIVIVPTTILTSNAMNKEEALYESVQTWGYDDQVSSTAEKMNDYMDIDQESTQNIYGEAGDMVLSGEPKLLENENYHSVIDDSDILIGVDQSDNGLGYLSTSWITGYNDANNDALSILKIYDVYNEEELSRDDVNAYVTPDTSNTDYIEAEEELQSTLNIVFKVPTVVTDSITTINNDDIQIDSEGAAKDYYDWLADEDYADDFVIALGFLDFMMTDSNNADYINTMAIEGTHVESVGAFDEVDVEHLAGIYNQIMKNDEGENTTPFISKLQEQQEATSNLYHVKIDGTGTNTGLVKVELNNFEEEFNSAANLTGESEIHFEYDLVNGGSGEAWKVPTNGIANGVVEAPATATDAREDAFLGTQSRFSEESEIEPWGYTNASNIEGEEITSYSNFTSDEHSSGDVFGFTMGIDLPVFFINSDFTFEYTVDPYTTQIENLDSIEFDVDENGNQIPQEVQIKPTGISDLGAKAIYEYGASWEFVMTNGWMIGEIA